MHFQIYFPGVAKEDHVILNAIQPGLSANTSWLPQRKGPDGKNGMLVTWDAEPYLDGVCRWVPAAADGDLPMGRYLLGVPVAKKPTPRELALWKEIKGESVPLGDGNAWTILAVGELPQVLSKDPETGQLRTAVKEKFRAIFDEACEWYLRCIDAGSSVEAPIDYWNYALRLLQFNYRMPPELLGELELIDSQNFMAIVLASLKGLRLADNAKKKTPAA